MRQGRMCRAEQQNDERTGLPMRAILCRISGEDGESERVIDVWNKLLGNVNFWTLHGFRRSYT